MRKILIVALGFASFAAMTGTASAYKLTCRTTSLRHLARRLVEHSRSARTAIVADTVKLTAKPPSTSLAAKMKIVSCTTTGVYESEQTYARRSIRQSSVHLGSCGGHAGCWKMLRAVGATPGANSTFAVGGLSTSRPTIVKTAPGNSTNWFRLYGRRRRFIVLPGPSKLSAAIALRETPECAVVQLLALRQPRRHAGADPVVWPSTQSHSARPRESGDPALSFANRKIGCPLSRV